MTTASTRRATISLTERLGWTARRVETRIAEVEYVAKMEAVVFRFDDGSIIGVPLRELDGSDATPVAGIRLGYDQEMAIIDQFSGNRLEVPGEVVRYHAGFACPCRRPGPRSAKHRGRDH